MVSVDIDIFIIWIFDILDKVIVIVNDVDNVVWIIVDKNVLLVIIDNFGRFKFGVFGECSNIVFVLKL